MFPLHYPLSGVGSRPCNMIGQVGSVEGGCLLWMLVGVVGGYMRVFLMQC